MTCEIIDITEILERRKFVNDVIRDAKQLHNQYCERYAQSGHNFDRTMAKYYGVVLSELEDA